MKLIPELEEIRKKGASNLQHVELVFNKYMEQKTITLKIYLRKYMMETVIWQMMKKVC